MNDWEEKRREEIWEAIEEAPELAHMLVGELLRQEKEQIREFAKDFLKFNEFNRDRLNKLLSERQIKGI